MTDKDREHKKAFEHEKYSADVQLLLANERTLLAWIRTGLAVVAGGIALAAFYKSSPLPGLLILILGILIALIGNRRYKMAEKSIRAGKLPASDKAAPQQLFVIAVLVLIIVILQVTLLSE